MRVHDVEIPQAVIDGLTRFIDGTGKTAGAIEIEATKLLLVQGITDTKRDLAMRVADRVIQRLRSQGQIHFVRDGRSTRWFPTTLH